MRKRAGGLERGGNGRMLCGMFGFLNVNKPPGPTSHDVVAGVRRLLPRRTKVGHAGTLDPFAEGILVLCVGPATRLADYVQKQPKRYVAEIRLGATSTTDDCEGEITEARDCPAPAPEAVREMLGRFVGTVQQVPPAHSAVHVNGQRAYKLARAGQTPDLPARTVTIHNIELLDYDFPSLRIEVSCGSGTYIRSLGRDVGGALGVGGYCTALTRTQVGPFGLDEAVAPDELDVASDLIDPLDGLPETATVHVDSRQADLLRNGRRLSITAGLNAAEVAVIDPAGRLVAIAAVHADGTRLQPMKVFPQQ